jgi:hypothetical protein
MSLSRPLWASCSPTLSTIVTLFPKTRTAGQRLRQSVHQELTERRFGAAPQDNAVLHLVALSAALPGRDEPATVRANGSVIPSSTVSVTSFRLFSPMACILQAMGGARHASPPCPCSSRSEASPSVVPEHVGALYHLPEYPLQGRSHSVGCDHADQQVQALRGAVVVVRKRVALLLKSLSIFSDLSRRLQYP